MQIVSALGTAWGALPASQRPAVLVNQAGARRLRPFARRRRMTARPERVRIRARNPWTFLRRRRLGWNVRFMGSGVWRACSANWAERLAGLGGSGAALRLPPSEVPTEECMRASWVRQLAFCHLFPIAVERRGVPWIPAVCFGFVFTLCSSVVAVLDEIRPLCYIPAPRSAGLRLPLHAQAISIA